MQLPVGVQACLYSLAFLGDRPPAAAAADDGVQAGKAFRPGLRHATNALTGNVCREFGERQGRACFCML